MEKTVSGNLLPFLKMYISYQESFFQHPTEYSLYGRHDWASTARLLLDVTWLFAAQVLSR